MSCQYFSVDNINQFQFEMHRPLYWFGSPGSAAVVASLSIAKQPKFTNGNKTITIQMKGWKFADGQTVNAESVMFFLNMYKADPSSYCGYNVGYGIPDQVASASGKGNTVVIHLKSSVNPGWILYNYLSEITPMPNSWDRTSANQTSNCASGRYGASSTNIACKKVETYLDAQSAKTSTYTNAMWQGGDDGPYRLTAFDDLGNATFKPNPHYSGPVKSKIAIFKEVAFTTTRAEENALQAGTIDLGYVDPTILTTPAPSPGVSGPNWSPLANRYNLISGSTWGFNYAPFNFSSADPKLAAIDQLYIRQALQDSVDQLSIITKVYQGYGFPISSPLPPNTATSISGPVANPYQFNLTAAKALLTSHGWTIQNGVQTCTNPGTGSGQCGAGIAQGYTLNFNIIWASGTPAIDAAFNLEIADWGSIGIQFTHATDTSNNVRSDCSGSAGYEICSWGDWNYAPDYYPSGETLFAVGGAVNIGSYSDAQMGNLINATTFGTTKLTAYATYAAQQLPVLYQPEAAVSNEVLKTIHDSQTFKVDPLLNVQPEYMSFG
jgi:peptide/nickel transport system substrate-binding protein